MKRKNKLILLLITGIIVIAGTIVFLQSRNSSAPINENESDGPGIVIIDGTDPLRKILLNDEYSATYNALDQYIREKIDKKIEHAIIASQPVLNNQTVTFIVKTENPEKQFEAVVDRTRYYQQIVFRVPSDNYIKTYNAE